MQSGKSGEMKPIEVPDSLLPFVKRQYFRKTGEDIIGTEYVNAGKWFIKDATRLKTWNSILYEGDISRFIVLDHTYTVSEKISILSEYRVFVHRDEV